jgi:hypothetical protein
MARRPTRRKNRFLPSPEGRWRWIEEWIKEHRYCTVSALSVDFHKAYSRAFPVYECRQNNFGFKPVAQAMRDLSDMRKAKVLTRERLKLGSNWQPGLPRSILTYRIPEQMLLLDVA